MACRIFKENYINAQITTLMEQQFKSMKALSFLIGNWTTTGDIHAGEKEPATKITGTDSYEWILDGAFILHKVDVMMGDKKTRAVEIIGEFDSTNKTYKMRSFDDQGNFTTMEAHIGDNGVLHISGDHMRSKLSVVDSNNMTAHWERLADNKNWQAWMDLTFSK